MPGREVGHPAGDSVRVSRHFPTPGRNRIQLQQRSQQTRQLHHTQTKGTEAKVSGLNLGPKAILMLLPPCTPVITLMPRTNQFRTRIISSSFRRDTWHLFTSIQLWEQLVAQTKKTSRDHSALAEIYANQILGRCNAINEDLQRIYKKVSFNHKSFKKYCNIYISVTLLN